jgi:hypothetical protein
MTIIQIAYEVPADAVARVEQVLDTARLTNPAWNGADFRIEREEYTCMPNNYSYDANALFSQIQAAIANQASE